MASPLGLTFKTETTAPPPTEVGQYRVVDNKAVKSLFNDAQFSPYPTSNNSISGSVDKIKNASEVHNDDSNDLSIRSIIDHCAKYPSMKLEYAHFAYLKNLGVYPNNRLIIARRFASGVANDLTQVSGNPISTLVSYFSDVEDIFSIKFNEEYTDADGGFEQILNDIGDDIFSGDNSGVKLGGMVKKAFDMIPLPGLMEGVQLEVMKNMGLAGEGQGYGKSPYGNPNIIREAKRRKVLGKGEAGSGLAASFTIKMVVEYEQKFINGVDPTLVYMDLLQNALTFGTSDAYFQYSAAFATGVTGIIKDLISGNIDGIIKAITQFIDSLITAMQKVVGELLDKLIDPPQEEEKVDKSVIGKVQSAIGEIFKATYGTIISKYKIRLIGVANALTGSPSAPWHVTIGNPKKPIFSSGDLLCTDVTLTLGKTLAFNDLPSSIKLEINLSNARNLGAQEIFNRFNTGRGRSYTRLNKSFVEVNDAVIQDKVKEIQNNKNAEKNSETQTNVQNANSTPPSDPIVKNEQTPTNNSTNNSNTPKDDYLANFNNNSGVLYGIKQSETSQDARVGDPSQGTIQNNTENKPSNQSLNDPNTPTSAVPPESKNNPERTTETPGVTASQTNSESNPPQPENTPAQTTENKQIPEAGSKPLAEVTVDSETGRTGVSNNSISAATDQELIDRQSYLRTQMKNTSPIIYRQVPIKDQNGNPTGETFQEPDINPTYAKLERESREIKNEQKNRKK